MSFTELRPFTLQFAPTLRTRELIDVTLQIMASGAGKYLLRLLPFVSVQSADAHIRTLLEAEVASTVHRWALTLASAEEALKPDAYKSLTEMIESIDSTEFTIDRVVVQHLFPITAPLPKPKPAPPPPPPTKTRAERIISERKEMRSTLKAVIQDEKESHEQDKELWEDPLIGNWLENQSTNTKGRIVFPDEEYL